MKFQAFIIFLFLHFLFFAQSKKKFVFYPNFEQGKEYFLKINDNNATSKPLDFNSGGCHFFKEEFLIKLVFENEFNHEKHYYYTLQESSIKAPPFKRCFNEDRWIGLKNVKVRFKTGENGRFIEITNLSNVINEVENNLSNKNIRSIIKNSSDSYRYRTNLEHFKNGAEGFIRSMNYYIQDYFKFYGIYFELGETSENIVRRFNFTRHQTLPFIVNIAFKQSQTNFDLNITNIFNKKLATDIHWENMITYQNARDKNDFKNLFQFDVVENAVFDDYGFLNKLKILMTENSNYITKNNKIFKEISIELIK